MKQLKELRESRGLTQKQLAELVGTTQQTVGRWENGKAEPSLSTLSDLAMIFGTSVDSVLGKSADRTTNAYYLYTSDEEDGFWGHIGIRLVGQDITTWHPISCHESQRIPRVFEADPEWVYIETLNNRALFVDVNKVQKIIFLDDAADGTEDFEIPWDGYDGLPAEMYQGMLNIALEYGDESSYSESFTESVMQFVREKQLDSADLETLLLDTQLHNEAGGIVSSYIDSSSLVALQMEVDGSHKAPKLIPLQENDNLTFYPASQLSMISAPLFTLLRPAQERLFADEEPPLHRT